MDYTDQVVILVFVIIAIVVVVLTGHLLSTMDDVNKCKADCASFSMSFFQYNAGGWMGTQTECWCRTANESKRIR